MGDEGHNESGFDGEPNGLTGAVDDITNWGNEMEEFDIPNLDYLGNVSSSASYSCIGRTNFLICFLGLVTNVVVLREPTSQGTACDFGLTRIWPDR